MSWGIAYYKAGDGTVPADQFLDSCPDKVEATIYAVLDAVREAPPPQFSGGGKWEAMHGSMRGYYEIRVTGPKRAVPLVLQTRERDTRRTRSTRFRQAADRGHHRYVQAEQHALHGSGVPEERARARG